MPFGPYAADGFFGSQLYDKFDGVLAMYHDQGLAPFKTLAMDDGVNYTAGLSIVRTSPAHGTAYDMPARMWPLKNLSARPYMLHWIFTGIVSVIVRQQPTLCASSISIKEVTMKSST